MGVSLSTRTDIIFIKHHHRVHRILKWPINAHSRDKSASCLARCWGQRKVDHWNQHRIFDFSCCGHHCSGVGFFGWVDLWVCLLLIHFWRSKLYRFKISYHCPSLRNSSVLISISSLVFEVLISNPIKKLILWNP